jgi:hypothetical protein
MFGSTTTPSPSPSPDLSSLCARSLPRPGRGVGVYPERLGAFRFSANLPTFQHVNPPTFLQPIPFRITSFADPHLLNPIESYLCKKQGGGSPIRYFFIPSVTHSNARNSNPVMYLLHDSRDIPGWGHALLSALSFRATRGIRFFCSLPRCVVTSLTSLLRIFTGHGPPATAHV